MPSLFTSSIYEIIYAALFKDYPNKIQAFSCYNNCLPISRPCTFPPAHWRLILLVHGFSLVIGGKIHSEYLGFSLLVANYSRNIPFFLHWRPGCRHVPQLCSLNIPNNSLYNASYNMCRKITSHWQPLFSKKMAVAASFSYKIRGGSRDLAILLAAVLTWSGYWIVCITH